jgi:hypothetical protein
MPMPVKVLLKGRIEKKGAGLARCFGLLLIYAMGYWDEAHKQPPWFNPDCVDFWCSVGIVAARVQHS